jgi:hypothetical protein
VTSGEIIKIGYCRGNFVMKKSKLNQERWKGKRAENTMAAEKGGKPSP